MEAFAISDGLGICGSDHKLSFYCSSCKRLFCGECSTITHSRKGALKDHDVELIEYSLTLEEHKKKHLTEELKQLSDGVEATANKQDSISKEELSNALSEFIAQVEQFLICDDNTQSLHRLYRESVGLLQQNAFPHGSDDATCNTAIAIGCLIKTNAVLSVQLKKISNAMENQAERQKPNVIEAIYKAAIALKERANRQGFLFFLCIFIYLQEIGRIAL